MSLIETGLHYVAEAGLHYVAEADFLLSSHPAPAFVAVVVQVHAATHRFSGNPSAKAEAGRNQCRPEQCLVFPLKHTR